MLKNNEHQEQLEFLKREEVRTMAKDVALLREDEAKKERERIVSLREIPRRGTKTEEPQPQPIPPPLMPHVQEQKPVFLKAGTRSEKILIRVIVVGVLLFILLNGLAFGYWYFTRKRVGEDGNQVSTGNLVSQSQLAPAPAGEAEPGNGNQVSSGNLVSPTPIFFETPQEKTIDLAATDDLLALLSVSLREEYPQGFTRILTSLTAREFLNKAAVAMPEPLLSLLKEDFMLFVYALPGRKRLGFIGELSRVEGVQDILRSWETTLEQDTKTLWEIVGQKGSAYTPFFRQTVYQNNVVRFQTFSVIDFGVVYTLFGTKFILATSFESLTKAVDQIIQSR